MDAIFGVSIVWCGHTHRALVLRSTHIMNKEKTLNVAAALLSSACLGSESASVSLCLVAGCLRPVLLCCKTRLCFLLYLGRGMLFVFALRLL